MPEHHAVLIVSTDATKSLNDYSLQYQGQTEIVRYTVSSVTIDDVRRIIALAYQTPGAYQSRTIVIEARSINHEAGHALLKVLEEPPLTTRFLLILPSLAGVLPTILSRVQVVDDSNKIHDISSTFRQFLESDPVVRLEQIVDIAKRKADDDYEALYDGLIQYGQGNQDPTIVPLVESSLRYLRQKGAAKKMIWESLALSLPVSKK